METGIREEYWRWVVGKVVGMLTEEELIRMRRRARVMGEEEVGWILEVEEARRKDEEEEGTGD